MTVAKSWNPLRLDVAAFCRSGEALSGEWPAVDLQRLADGAVAEAPASDWPPVRWHLQGEERPVAGAEPEIWLRLEVQAEARPSCQRCLQPAAQVLLVDRWFRFVRNETEAAELDADSEDDVLVLSRVLDCREWIEDELLLALPIVPMHEQCPKPLPMTADAAAEPELEERPHPFAALAALRRKPDEGPA